jgi:hypothetical protein
MPTFDEEPEEEIEDVGVKSTLPTSWKSSERLRVRTSKNPTKDLLKLYVWNTLSPCHKEECPIHDRCPHATEDISVCKIEKFYIDKVAEMAWNNFNKKFTEDQFFMVGMHILPMYRHLCRLKLWEWSVLHVMYEDERGKRHINPIYKEIREQIKAISAQWKGLGVGNFQIVEPRNPWGTRGKPDPNYVDDMENPTEYYEKMLEGKIQIQSPRRVVPLKRAK